jgi:hypothetical protein
MFREDMDMKRLWLGVALVFGVLILGIVVVDHANRRPGTEAEANVQPSVQDPRADSAPQTGSKVPTPISERTIKVALGLPGTDANAIVRLLPNADQLVAGDAYVLYEKACNALPAALDEDVLSEWGRMKPEALPLDSVKSLLDQSQEAFSLIDQANFCKDCNWPAVAVNAQPPDHSAYRVLARLMGLRAAYEIADDNPQGSIQALRMGFGMARHVAQGPTTNHGLVGVGIAALTIRQIPVLAEQPNGLSLYAALESLPTPLISLDKAIQSELDNLDKNPKVNFLNRRAFLSILEPVHERVRFLATRFDRDMKALQCLEAIRLYCAAHNGALPQTLSQITSWSVPQDPVHQQPFVYALSGDTAILESPAPQGDPRSRLQYEITVKQSQ